MSETPWTSLARRAGEAKGEDGAMKLHAKANDLRERGDALTREGNRAEGQRLLRECRRLRLQARDLEARRV